MKYNPRKYSIVDYVPKWKSEFEAIKRTLVQVFGKKTIIEHIGSTSIKGMSAKPLIDVLVIVKKISTARPLAKLLVKKGYVLRENVLSSSSLLLEFTNGETKTQNIHVFTPRAKKVKEFLAVRNFLNTHPKIAKEYSDLKKELYQKFPNDYFAYREGKYSLLKRITRDALAWKP